MLPARRSEPANLAVRAGCPGTGGPAARDSVSSQVTLGGLVEAGNGPGRWREGGPARATPDHQPGRPSARVLRRLSALERKLEDRNLNRMRGGAEGLGLRGSNSDGAGGAGGSAGRWGLKHCPHLPEECADSDSDSKVAKASYDGPGERPRTRGGARRRAPDKIEQ